MFSNANVSTSESFSLRRQGGVSISSKHLNETLRPPLPPLNLLHNLPAPVTSSYFPLPHSFFILHSSSHLPPTFLPPFVVKSIPAWKLFIFGGSVGELDSKRPRGSFENDVMVLTCGEGEGEWSFPDTGGTPPSVRTDRYERNRRKRDRASGERKSERRGEGEQRDESPFSTSFLCQHTSFSSLLLPSFRFLLHFSFTSHSFLLLLRLPSFFLIIPYYSFLILPPFSGSIGRSGGLRSFGQSPGPLRRLGEQVARGHALLRHRIRCRPTLCHHGAEAVHWCW